MNKDFSTVCSQYSVNEFEYCNMSKKEIEKRIKTELIFNLANYIIENMNDLPLEYEIKDNSELFQFNPVKEYITRINLISNKEIERLKQIESEYSRMNMLYR